MNPLVSEIRGSIDFHVHPAGDRQQPPTPLAAWARRLATSTLDVVVITDHNAIETAERLRDLVGKRRPELVTGEEIDTREGHLLGLGLHRPISCGLAIWDAVAAVHDTGGLAIVAHPLLPARVSVSARALCRLADADQRHRPDGIESFNPLAARYPLQSRRVRDLAERLALPMLGGSDAHAPEDLALGRTRFSGRSFLDFRRAVAAGETSPEGDPYPIARVLRIGLGQLSSSELRLTR